MTIGSDRAALHATLADELASAARRRIPVRPLSARHPELGQADAYAVARHNVDARLAAGAHLVGHKVGLTSAAMQQMLGVDQPDYGAILDDMILPSGATVDVDRWIAPRIEPEIAFLLGRALRGPGVSTADVLAASDAVAPSLEIIDSRIADWRITLVDTVADNASSAAVVIGEWVALDPALDLAALEGVLVRNGDEIDRGLGAAVLGHPAEAVAWLVNTLADLGTPVDAGAVIMPGSVTRAVDVVGGDTVSARFGPIGSVTVTFT